MKFKTGAFHGVDMYFLGMDYENALLNGNGTFRIETGRAGLARWSLLPPGEEAHELLQLIALGCGGVQFLPGLACDLSAFLRSANPPLRIEFLVTPHVPLDIQHHAPVRLGGCLEIGANGEARWGRRRSGSALHKDVPVRKPGLSDGNRKYLLLGYGPSIEAVRGPEDFEFLDPLHRTRRFRSLFGEVFCGTDPAAFLARLHYRGILKSRYPAWRSLIRLQGLFERFLNIDTSKWTERGCDFKDWWQRLSPLEQRLCLPLLDAARHMTDAFPFSGKPLEEPGLMLLHRPEERCGDKCFSSWVRVLDGMMPGMQFVMSVCESSRNLLPENILKQRLELPRNPTAPSRSRTALRAFPGTVVLHHLDGRLPNLALMKLGRYHKQCGRTVVLERKGRPVQGADAVYASCVFTGTATRQRMKALERRYGGDWCLGGSGVDVGRRLPAAIEDTLADYSLYPELRHRAIGFLTRGCPFRCKFCVVPLKEGGVRQVNSLEDLLQGDRTRLILLDDNLLAHPRACELLAEMVERNIQVNFNQTLDIRLLDREKAGLLRRVRYSNVAFNRRVIHFSLNDTSNLDLVRRKYRLMAFTPKDHVEFICMYGFNTTLAEDVARFRFLKSLPGAYVFVQKYQPIPGGPEPNLDAFFDENADELIDELIAIVFPENMKSMETYFRWVSRLYAERFHRLHRGLVNAIFRYNRRHSKGRYIATLAGTRKDLLMRGGAAG